MTLEWRELIDNRHPVFSRVIDRVESDHPVFATFYRLIDWRWAYEINGSDPEGFWALGIFGAWDNMDAAFAAAKEDWESREVYEGGEDVYE